MSLRFSSRTFAACCGEDLILLDTKAGSYACLPGCAPLVGLSPGNSSVAIFDKDLAEGLMQIGAVEEGEGAPRHAVAPAERDLTFAGSTSLRISDVGAMLAALAGMAVTYWRVPFGQMIEGVEARGTGICSEEPWLIPAARAFGRMLPWVPAQGVCLYRSFYLLAFLRRRGLSASWVFGVQTYTFEAHCWLQAGDLVLGDHVEHVRGFAPILALEP